MDRREFLFGSLSAAMAAPLAAGIARAQQVRPPVVIPAPVPVTRRLVLDANSRALQWLRSADEVAAAAVEIVCGGVCPTVQTYPGHIDPARVSQELPAFINRIRSHGLRVTQVKGPAIIDAEDPNVERIV